MNNIEVFTVVVFISIASCCFGDRYERMGLFSSPSAGPQRVTITLNSGRSYTNVTILAADVKSITIQDGTKEREIPRMFLKPEDSKRIRDVKRQREETGSGKAKQ